MAKEPSTLGRCIHCLRQTDVLEADHVFPKSWYPDTTPANTQRWTAPSCSECNRNFGQLEKDLLVRVIPCIDPKSAAVAGLPGKVLRTLGVGAEGLSEKDQQHREALRKKVRSEFMRTDDLKETSGKIPGLGPPEGVEAPFAIPIPWAGLAIMAEKIVRGCEFRLKNRFVEEPYGLQTFVRRSEAVLPDAILPEVQKIDFGPGCRIQRISPPEDPNMARYWITVWNALHFDVPIDHLTHFQQVQDSYVRPGGIDLSDRPSMKINPYLRTYEN